MSIRSNAGHHIWHSKVRESFLTILIKYFGPGMILSAILRTVTTLFGPGVTLSAILRSVMTVLADLGGVGTILAGGNIVIYFHSHRSGEHLKEIEFL